jgi:hypothetical protein
MHVLADVMARRDQIIMRGILHELRDGFGGHIEPRDNPLVGASWLEGRPTIKLAYTVHAGLPFGPLAPGSRGEAEKDSAKRQLNRCSIPYRRSVLQRA